MTGGDGDRVGELHVEDRMLARPVVMALHAEAARAIVVAVATAKGGNGVINGIHLHPHLRLRLRLRRLRRRELKGGAKRLILLLIRLLETLYLSMCVCAGHEPLARSV